MRSNAKAFVRSYGFLSSILPYANPEWDEPSIFLNLLIPKLPAPKEEDLSRGILETVDMESYRAEKRETSAIALEDEDAEVGPVPADGGGGRPESELDRLSSIVKTFNDPFGDVEWDDADRVRRTVAGCRAESEPTPPIATRWSAATARTPASSTTRRSTGRCRGFFATTPSHSSVSATIPSSSAGWPRWSFAESYDPDRR